MPVPRQNAPNRTVPERNAPIAVALIAALFVGAVTLSACGRRGALEAPEGSTYPRSYPVDYGSQKDSDKTK